LGASKPNAAKQDSQSRLWLPMPEKDWPDFYM